MVFSGGMFYQSPGTSLSGDIDFCSCLDEFIQSPGDL